MKKHQILLLLLVSSLLCNYQGKSQTAATRQDLPPLYLNVDCVESVGASKELIEQNNLTVIANPELEKKYFGMKVPNHDNYLLKAVEKNWKLTKYEVFNGSYKSLSSPDPNGYYLFVSSEGTDAKGKKRYSHLISLMKGEEKFSQIYDKCIMGFGTYFLFEQGVPAQTIYDWGIKIIQENIADRAEHGIQSTEQLASLNYTKHQGKKLIIASGFIKKKLLAGDKLNEDVFPYPHKVVSDAEYANYLNEEDNESLIYLPYPYRIYDVQSGSVVYCHEFKGALAQNAAKNGWNYTKLNEDDLKRIAEALNKK